MPNAPSSRDFLDALTRWSAFAPNYWWDDPARPDLGCFGTGYNNWGVQTNQKFIGACAVLAGCDETNEDALGESREALLERTLKALRYSLASHISGDHHCSDGSKWGHTWISALGIERMMHGLEAIGEHFSEEDHANLRRMLVSECNWLLNLEIQGTKWARDGGNKPESNIWNGAILARTAMMYPDDARVPDWLEKATGFFINGISITADAVDDTLVRGRPISQWHVGPNFFTNYALDHHAYLNVGYMVICLSNIAMMHYSQVTREQGAPAGLYHHAADLWQVLRRFIFTDGRLCRIGGDSRQRYCYCQDYLLPTLVFCADFLHDAHAPELEAGALNLVRTEQAFCDDNSFLSSRLTTIRNTNPYYYTRLESDKAVVLSMNAWWRKNFDIPDAEPAESFVESTCGNWAEIEHGAVMTRSHRRIASWSWRAREAPQGLCLPPEASHLAEWCENMGGRVTLLGSEKQRTVMRHQQASFDGGFITWGCMADCPQQFLPEGWKGSEVAPHQIAAAALPDDRTMIVMERCRVDHRTYLTEVKGLKLNVPNDLFNGFNRSYRGADGILQIEGTGEGMGNLGYNWANVDDTIGVVGIYGGDSLILYQAGSRRASGYGDSLYYDELCFPCRLGLWDAAPGEVVLDCASIVLSGADTAATEEAARRGARRLECDHDLVRVVCVRGADEKDYLMAANFGVAEATFVVTLPAAMIATNLVGEVNLGADGTMLALTLEAGEAIVARLS